MSPLVPAAFPRSCSEADGVHIYQLLVLFLEGGNLSGVVGTKKGNLLRLSCRGGGRITRSPAGTAQHGQEAKLQPSLGGAG
jgi:hypothetical protein